MNVTIKKPPFSSNKRVVKIRIWWRWTNAVQVENGIENNEIMRDGRKAMIYAKGAERYGRSPVIRQNVDDDHAIEFVSFELLSLSCISLATLFEFVDVWPEICFRFGSRLFKPPWNLAELKIFGDAKTIPVSGVLAHRKYFGASLPSPNVHWQRVNKPFDSHVKTSGFDRNNTHVEMWKEQLTLL